MAKIACVEPMPDNVRLLRVNLALNKVDAAVFPAAAAAEDGTVLMKVASKDYQHKVATVGINLNHDAKTISVTAMSIPSILKQLGWKRIGLLKVDIEGSENELLAVECRWLDLVDAMCIEFHDGFGVDDLARVAREHGFSSPRRLPGIWLVERVQASPKEPA